MANRFLNNITINDEYTLPAADGTADQIIVTDGAGNLSFIDTTTISVGESEQVHIACKNTSGVAISKGDPVYITGTVGTSFRVEIAAADASNSAKMPAVGLAESDLAINAEGYVVVSGVLKNLTTDPLSTGDGTPSSNDTVYVKAGGGLTKTKPTGSSNLIQNVGKVGRVNSANAGSIAVSTIMRTNDVPNLSTGKIWVGSSTYTTESGVVYLDESNGRMGIGTTDPSEELHISSGNPGIRLQDSDGTDTFGRIHFTNTNLQFFSRNGTSNGLFSWYGSNGTIDTERMRIAADGNVGIGVTNPAVPLHVGGFARLNGGLQLNTSDATIYQIQNSSLRLGTNNTERMRIDSSGNVGIGMTNPQRKLDISANANDGIRLAANNALIGGGAAGGDAQLLYWNGSIAYYGRGSLGGSVTQHEFRTSGTTRVLIDSSGNVGIGTTSPNTKLEVDGIGYFIGGTPPDFGAGDTPTDVGIILSEGDYIYTRDVNNLRRLIGKGTDDIIRIGATGTSLIDGIDFMSGVTPLYRWFSNASEIMRLDGTGLGIGTTSPSYSLSVNGAIQTDMLRGYTYPTNSYIDLDYDQTATNNSVGIASIADILYLADTNNNASSTTPAHLFTTGNGDIDSATRLANIYHNGKLQLNLYGSGTFTGTATQRLAVDSSGNVIEIPIGSGPVDGSGAANQVAFWTDADTISGENNLYWDSTNDRLGIQVTPSQPLDVNGTALIRNTIYVGDDIQHWGDGGTGMFFGTDTISLKNDGGSTRLFVESGGNVGIGETSVDARLHITTATAGLVNQKFESAGSAAWRVGIPASQTYFAFDNANDNLSAPKVVIDSSGNVGIGETNPTSKLVVTDNTDGQNETFSVNHSRSNSDVATRAINVDMNLSGSDTTTADRTNYGIFVDLDSSADGDASNEHRIYGVGADVRFTGFSDLARGGYFYVESNNNTEKTAQLVGVYGIAVHDSSTTSGGVSNMYGAYGTSQIQDLGDVDNAFGGYFSVTISTNRGNADVGVTKGVEAEIQIDEDSSINYGSMIGVSSIIDNNEGTVPNFGPQYLFKGDYQGTKGSNAYGIYTEGDKHYFDGKVGIKETSPSQELHVSGNARVTGAYYDSNNSAGTSGQVLSSTATGTDWVSLSEISGVDGTGTTNYVAKWSDADTITNSIIYDDGTNVGIGDTTPSVKLDVVDSTVGTISTFSTLGDGGGSANRGLAIKSRTDGGEIITVGSSTNLYLNTANNLYLQNASSTKATMLANGNIGIGTTNPIYSLDVNSGTDNTIARFLSSDDVGQIQISDDDTDTWIGSKNGLSYISPTAGTPSDGLAISSSSNVGIGTTGPSDKLHIVGSNGSVRIDNSSSAKSFSLTVMDSNNRFRIYDNTASSERLTITNGGDVGIGETNPGYKLTVAGDIFTNTKFVTDSNELLGIYQSSWTGNEDHYVLYNAWKSGTGDYLLVKSSGNQAGTNGAILIADGNSGRTFFGRHANTSAAIDSSTSPLDETYAFIGATDTYFSSNVGIGTTSPGSELEVDGEITTTTITYDEPGALDSSAYNGEIVYFGSQISMTEGKLMVLSTSAAGLTWYLAKDSTTSLATGMLGIALGTAASDGVLVRGIAKNSAWSSFSEGEKLYLSPTGGSISNSITSDTNDFVRIVGYALGGNEIYFCPDNTYIQNS